jgi:DNA-binding MarR family transcriptional regulator
MRHRREVLHEFIRSAHVLAGVIREGLLPELLAAAGAGRLTIEQLNVLRLIDRHGVHTLNLLAKFLAITPPAACVMVDKLTSLGLVSRSENPDDRREVLIGLTARGRRLVQRYRKLEERRFAELLDDLTSDDAAVFTRVAHRLARETLRTAPSPVSLCLQCGAFDSGGCLIPDLKGVCAYLPARCAVSE